MFQCRHQLVLIEFNNLKNAEVTYRSTKLCNVRIAPILKKKSGSYIKNK